MLGHADPLAAEPVDGTIEMDRVPVRNGRDDQVEPGSAVLLVLQGAIDDAALLVGEHGLGEDVAGFALVEPGMAALTQLGALQPIEGEEWAPSTCRPKIAEGGMLSALRGRRGAGDLIPDRKRGGPRGPILGGGEVIAAEMEEVVDLVMSREEPLRLTG
jgi:hypothetical protein